jgi:RHS repeat-associated protein
MRKVALYIAILLVAPLSLYAQNTGPGLPPFGSFTQGGFDTINNQNLNVIFSIPLISSAGRRMPLNLSLTYNSLVFQNYESTWLPAPPYGQWGWFTPGGGYVSYTTLTTVTKCGLNWGNQTRYYNYTYTDMFGTVHAIPSISIVHFCNATWSGTFTGTTTDNTGFYVDASKAPPYATVTTPNGAQALNALDNVADTNGNYITVSGSGTETDWTDSIGNKAAKIIYTPNQSTPTSVQYEFLDGNGNYQISTMKYQAYSIQTNFGCSGVTEYTGTAYLPYEMDIPSPVSGTLKYTFTYEKTPGLSGPYTGRLQQVTLPTGGSYQYTYPGTNDSINCSDGTTLSLSRTINDGTNPAATWTFVRNTTLNTTIVTTPALVDTPNANASVYTFNSLGQETQEQIFPTTSTTGTALRTIQPAWASNGTPQNVTTFLEDGQTESEVETTYDSNGLLDSVVEFAGGSPGPGAIVRTTTYTYNTSTNYTSRNILNLVTSKVIKDGSGTIQYRQDTIYDGNAITNCPTGVPQHDDTDYPCSMNYRGNPTQTITYLTPATGTNPIKKNFTYDVFGNLLTAQVNCCQSKNWVYSGTTQYSQPDSVTSGTSPTLTTNYTYNLYLGLPTKTVDPNSMETDYAYDFLRRITSVSQKNGATAGSNTAYAYSDTAFTTTGTTSIDSSHAIQQISTADGLGRPVTTTVEDASNNVYSIVKSEYDQVGRNYGTSNPYLTGNPAYSVTAFDVLGRVVSTTLPDGSATEYTYSLFNTTVTDPAGNQRESTTDGLGRLTVVTEPDVTNGNKLSLTTTYTYTVLDALASVTTPDQTRTFNYDALGKLLSTITPEGGKTCFGSVTGSTCNTDGYDPSDNMPVKRTDARGVLTSYTYDGLNRLTQVSYNVGTTGVPATPTVALTYGTSSCTTTNGAGCIGQVITMTDGVGSESYTYNALEQLTQLQKVNNGTTYTTSYSYNLANELTQITYPSGRAVAQSVDNIGRLSSIVGTLNSVQTTYASGYAYNPANQFTGFLYGNGVYASLGYTSSRLQLNCLDYSTTNRSGTGCTHDSTTQFGLNYSYAAAPSNNGQIASITDAVDNGRSVAYTYDGLARLLKATTTGSANYPAWGLQQSYDRYGNRTSQTASSGCVAPMTCPQPSVTVSLTTNHISGTPYTYDANGNMTNDGVNTLVYDGENRIASASGSLGSGTYTYDGKGFRVKKTSSSITTVYVFSGSKVIAEYDNGAGVTTPTREYVYGGSALVAKIDASGTKYYHQDHLSNRLVTSSTGSTLEQMGHFPFGESWYNGSADKLLFTSYERDSESGNDFAMARYHVNRLGRFSSPDSVAGHLADPQTLNRYAYARNNPLTFVDPTGLNLAEDLWYWFGGGDGGGGGGGGAAGAGGGGDIFSGFCDASCGGSGFDGGVDVNGVPMNFGPGYLQSQNSGPSQLQAGVARYISIITTGWDPALGIQYYENSITWTGGDGSVLEQQQELAATKLGTSVCNKPGDNVQQCIQDAYDGLTVDTDIGDNGLLGGNWNFSYAGLEINGQQVDPSNIGGCTADRCGTFNSMDFSHGDSSFHVDTANVYSMLGFGAVVHGIVDYIGGHTWWSSGIPRPWF